MKFTTKCFKNAVFYSYFVYDIIAIFYKHYFYIFFSARHVTVLLSLPMIRTINKKYKKNAYRNLKKDSRSRIKRHHTNFNNLDFSPSGGEVQTMIIVSSKSAITFWTFSLPRLISRTQTVPTEYVKTFG